MFPALVNKTFCDQTRICDALVFLLTKKSSVAFQLLEWARFLAERRTTVCQLYVPRTDTCAVKMLRWWLFRMEQAHSERLHPTQANLSQAILRDHYQLMVWNNDEVTIPPFHPQTFWLDGGWKWIGACHDAPDGNIYLVKCKCAKERCSTNRCNVEKMG